MLFDVGRFEILNDNLIFAGTVTNSDETSAMVTVSPLGFARSSFEFGARFPNSSWIV